MSMKKAILSQKLDFIAAMVYNQLQLIFVGGLHSS